MADTKISAAGDAGVLISTDMVPLARSGNVNAFRATMAEVATYTSAAAPVQSVATRTGAVTLTHTDITDWAATLAPYAPLASPTFTGTPSLPTGAVAVTQTAGTSNTTLATTAFVGSALTSFAPLASPVLTGNPTAPTPAYGDNDTSIPTTAFVQSAVAPAFNDAGRNLVTNGTFVVQQRGTGPWTGNYTADRWLIGNGGDTATFTIAPLIDADRAAIGNESATSAMQNVFIGTASGYNYINQYIENIRRLSGKTVTLSFWAKANSGTPRLGMNALMSYGTGGSATGAAWALTTGNAVTISTTWARYSSTIALPSASGKTLGTNNDDSVGVAIFFSTGTSLGTIGGSIGVQSGTIQLWGIQLEIGTQATPFDAGGTPQQILAECQRFYQIGTAVYWSGVAASGVTLANSVVLPVTMRASPTTTSNFTTASNVTSPGISVLGPGALQMAATSAGGGTCGLTATFTASADL